MEGWLNHPLAPQWCYCTYTAVVNAIVDVIIAEMIIPLLVEIDTNRTALCMHNK